MKDLYQVSGLPLKLDEKTNQLIWGEGLAQVKPRIRRLNEMRELLLDSSVEGPEELYYMYRDVHFSKDERLIIEHNLRYDITIILPGMLGREYMKTAGHYHPLVLNTKLSYPEVYEVLSGLAHYLLQRVEDINRKVAEVVVKDIVLIEARPGAKVVIPPNYGHVTINPGKEPLVMSNWVERNFSSLYGSIREAKGVAYLEVKMEGERKFIPNNCYVNIPKLRVVEPKDVPEFGLKRGLPMYTSFLRHPEKFKFLTSPQLWERELASILT